MKTLEEYVALAGQSHGHMCPGQVLGIRMAMLGLRSIGIDDPVKDLDYGKVAATFVNLETGRAVRVVARDDSRAKAKAMFPAITDSSRAQLEAYKVMEIDDLFNLEAVRVKLKPEDLPGRPRSRVTCEQCGEGVNDGRERRLGDRVLCRSCAGERYYEPVTSDE
jgi:formylmethanofuran dehydrogenase subunit E